MPRRCLNTVQRRKVQPATVPDASRVAGAGKVRLDELLTETITGEWGGESSPSKGVAVLRTTNFTNCGEINYDNLAWREIAKDKVERKHLCVGDIVVEKSGGTKDHPVGRVVFFDRADGLYLCNNFTQILRPDRNLIVPRFLFYTLRAKYEMRVTESMYNKTTGIQNLKMSLYMAMPVTLPPIPAQQRIADELDQLCALKKNAEDRLAILDQIVKSRFVEMFGDVLKEWDKQLLGDIAFITKLAGFEYTKYIKYQDHGDVIMIRGLNCKKTKLVLDDVYWIDRATSDLLPRSKLSKGDLVFTYVGTVGEVAVVDRDNTYHLAPNVAKIELNDKEKFNPYFFAYELMYLREYVLKFSASTTQAALSMDRIRKIPLPVPPSSLQREFAAFVAEVDKSELTLRETVATLDQLYRAKLQEYFG